MAGNTEWISTRKNAKYFPVDTLVAFARTVSNYCKGLGVSQSCTESFLKAQTAFTGKSISHGLPYSVLYMCLKYMIKMESFNIRR